MHFWKVCSSRTVAGLVVLTVRGLVLKCNHAFRAKVYIFSWERLP